MESISNTVINNQEILDKINNYIMNGQINLAKSEAEILLSEEPNNCLAITFLAHIYRKMGESEQAINLCNQVLAINAKFYSALVEKARILAEQNNNLLACHIYIQIYENYPQIQEYLLEWCKSLAAIEDYATLQKVAELGIKNEAQDADFYFYLGLSLQLNNKHAESIKHYEKANSLNTKMSMILNNLGAAYKEIGNLPKAKEILELEINNDAQNYLAWTNYGSVLQKLDELDKAHECFIKAININPNYSIAYNNLGLLLREKQDIKGSEQALEASIKMDHNYISAKWNLAMTKLVQGNYKDGLELHEYRWNGSAELRSTNHGLQKPEWDGKIDLKDKKLFLWGEQGFGDALQFCRFIPLLAEYVKKQGGELLYCCFTNLHELFISSFQGLVKSPIIHDKQRPLPEFDYHVPLLKLPLIFNTDLSNIPNKVPYIKASMQAKKKFSDVFVKDNELKVGLIWTGSNNHQRNPYRSVGIENYLRFKDIDGAKFYGLQFDAQKSINLANSSGFKIDDLTPHIHNFDESAAIIEQLDLVITTCTSTAHLSGALGIPTWVLLDVNPHWVWLLDRTDSPWYPSVKLYRQKEYKNWDVALEKVHKDLVALCLAKNLDKNLKSKKNKAKKY